MTILAITIIIAIALVFYISKLKGKTLTPKENIKLKTNHTQPTAENINLKIITNSNGKINKKLKIDEYGIKASIGFKYPTNTDITEYREVNATNIKIDSFGMKITGYCKKTGLLKTFNANFITDLVDLNCNQKIQNELNFLIGKLAPFSANEIPEPNGNHTKANTIKLFKDFSIKNDLFEKEIEKEHVMAFSYEYDDYFQFIKEELDNKNQEIKDLKAEISDLQRIKKDDRFSNDTNHSEQVDEEIKDLKEQITELNNSLKYIIELKEILKSDKRIFIANYINNQYCNTNNFLMFNV